MISSLSNLGYPIHDANSPTPLYNNNNVCVKWCHNMTTKGNRHIENWENATREWAADGTISITHVSGKCNVLGIFTKEMRDSSNFRHLQDLFMCCSSNFLKRVHHIAPDTTPHTPPVLAQSTQHVTSDRPGMLDVLVAYSSLCIPSALSCISAAGRHILSRLAPPSYSHALMSNPMGGVLTVLT
jgi:hypothetical protein